MDGLNVRTQMKMHRSVFIAVETAFIFFCVSMMLTLLDARPGVITRSIQDTLNQAILVSLIILCFVSAWLVRKSPSLSICGMVTIGIGSLLTFVLVPFLARTGMA